MSWDGLGSFDFVAWVIGVSQWVWGFWQTKFLLAQIGLNFVLAVAVTIRTGEFVLARTAEVLYRKVLPYLLIFAFLAAFGNAINLEWLTTASWLLLVASLTSDMLDNLRKLGVPIPEGLTKARLENGTFTARIVED